MKKHYAQIICLALLSLFVAGCATSRKVQVIQMGDDQLTCKELTTQMKGMDKAQANVDSKKGMTGTNVASALFWIPGLAYTYYDAGQATKLISERKSHLIELYNKKGCDKK